LVVFPAISDQTTLNILWGILMDPLSQLNLGYEITKAFTLPYFCNLVIARLRFFYNPIQLSQSHGISIRSHACTPICDREP
jgi:hypothetical protein